MNARRHAVLLTGALLALSTAVALADDTRTLQWDDGRYYTGTLRHGRPDGKGVQVWPDGMRYSGGWRDGRREGFGTLLFPDGRRYVGRFAGDRATGEGELQSPMGTRYRPRLMPDGTIAPGAMLGAPDRPAQTAARPGSLEDWLRGP